MNRVVDTVPRGPGVNMLDVRGLSSVISSEQERGSGRHELPRGIDEHCQRNPVPSNPTKVAVIECICLLAEGYFVKFGVSP